MSAVLFICMISMFLRSTSATNDNLTPNSTFIQSLTKRSESIDSKLQHCSATIIISSFGPSKYVQGSVLGIYLINKQTIEKWPTWKMKHRSNRFLYKCPCGTKWLFGGSNGASEGWIKHPNCTDCPENCSRNWQYWNDDKKQWYTDSQIITEKYKANGGNEVDKSEVGIWKDIQNMRTWFIITMVVLTCSICALCSVILYYYSCCKKLVPIWVIVVSAVYSMVILLFFIVAGRYSYHKEYISNTDFGAYFVIALLSSWIVSFYGIIPCCRMFCSSDQSCAQCMPLGMTLELHDRACNLLQLHHQPPTMSGHQNLAF